MGASGINFLFWPLLTGPHDQLAVSGMYSIDGPVRRKQKQFFKAL